MLVVLLSVPLLHVKDEVTVMSDAADGWSIVPPPTLRTLVPNELFRVNVPATTDTLVAVAAPLVVIVPPLIEMLLTVIGLLAVNEPLPTSRSSTTGTASS